jgi:hypothetical protein
LLTVDVQQLSSMYESYCVVSNVIGSRLSQCVPYFEKKFRWRKLASAKKPGTNITMCPRIENSIGANFST